VNTTNFTLPADRGVVASHSALPWLRPPASATRDLCGRDFVAKRVAACLLDPLERPLDGGRTSAAWGLPEREHPDSLLAVAQVERVVRIPAARDGLAQVGDGPADRHDLAVEAVGVGEDCTGRGVECASGPRGGEQEPERRDRDQKSTSASVPLREALARASGRHMSTLTSLQHQPQALRRPPIISSGVAHLAGPAARRVHRFAPLRESRGHYKRLTIGSPRPPAWKTNKLCAPGRCLTGVPRTRKCASLRPANYL